MSGYAAQIFQAFDAGVETFKQAFASLKPQMDSVVATLQNAFVEEAIAPLKDVKGDETYGKPGGGSLADLRMEVDLLSTTWVQQTKMLEELEQTDPAKAKEALNNLGARIGGLEAQVAKAPFVKAYDSQSDKKEDVEKLRAVIKHDTDLLRFMWNDLADAADGLEYGSPSGNTNHELVEAWNSDTRQYEFHHPVEWEKMKERRGFIGESKTPLTKVKDQYGKDTSVSIQTHANTWLPASGAFLKWERQATEQMRAGLTTNVNQRLASPKLKTSVENNCNMATKLAGLLTKHPDLLAPEVKGDPTKTGGLLNRIIGGVEGQGQFKERPADPKTIVDDLVQSAQRLKEGKGAGDDANKVQQFIGCFIDGLTEVLEPDKGTAKQQFDLVWPDLRDALGLKDGDKEKLLNRVKGYKEIAGAASDTLGGKGKRKAFTRTGSMPDDPRYKLQEEDALLKGDISGSMHSQLLATELAETLSGDEPKIKEMGESVQVKDKEILNARVHDALAITAGGMLETKDKDGTVSKADLVLHTAWEMMNGMRAITGLDEIDQSVATYAMKLMRRGLSFTDAMERILPPAKLPWLSGST